MEKDIEVSHKPNGPIVDLKSYFTLWLENLEKFFSERDRRYAERFDASDKAVERALIAVEKQHSQAVTANEKAIEKSEEAQTKYNEVHNDLTRRMIPRPEYETDKRTFEEKLELLKRDNLLSHDEIKRDIQLLREGVRETGGKEQRGVTDQQRSQWVIMATVSVIAIVISCIGLVANIAIFLIINFVMK